KAFITTVQAIQDKAVQAAFITTVADIKDTKAQAAFISTVAALIAVSPDAAKAFITTVQAIQDKAVQAAFVMAFADIKDTKTQMLFINAIAVIPTDKLVSILAAVPFAAMGEFVKTAAAAIPALMAKDSTKAYAAIAAFAAAAVSLSNSDAQAAVMTAVLSTIQGQPNVETQKAMLEAVISAIGSAPGVEKQGAFAVLMNNPAIAPILKGIREKFGDAAVAKLQEMAGISTPKALPGAKQPDIITPQALAGKGIEAVAAELKSDDKNTRMNALAALDILIKSPETQEGAVALVIAAMNDTDREVANKAGDILIASLPSIFTANKPLFNKTIDSLAAIINNADNKSTPSARFQAMKVLYEAMGIEGISSEQKLAVASTIFRNLNVLAPLSSVNQKTIIDKVAGILIDIVKSGGTNAEGAQKATDALVAGLSAEKGIANHVAANLAGLAKALNQDTAISQDSKGWVMYALNQALPQMKDHKDAQLVVAEAICTNISLVKEEHRMLYAQPAAEVLVAAIVAGNRGFGQALGKVFTILAADKEFFQLKVLNPLIAVLSDGARSGADRTTALWALAFGLSALPNESAFSLPIASAIVGNAAVVSTENLTGAVKNGLLSKATTVVLGAAHKGDFSAMATLAKGLDTIMSIQEMAGIKNDKSIQLELKIKGFSEDKKMLLRVLDSVMVNENLVTQGSHIEQIKKTLVAAGVTEAAASGVCTWLLLISGARGAQGTGWDPDKMDKLLNPFCSEVLTAQGIVVEYYKGYGVSILSIVDKKMSNEGVPVMTLSDISGLNPGYFGVHYSDRQVMYIYAGRMLDSAKADIAGLLDKGLVQFGTVIHETGADGRPVSLRVFADDNQQKEMGKLLAHMTVSSIRQLCDQRSNPTGTAGLQTADIAGILKFADILEKRINNPEQALSAADAAWLKSDEGISARNRATVMLGKNYTEGTTAHELRHNFDYKNGYFTSEMNPSKEALTALAQIMAPGDPIARLQHAFIIAVTADIAKDYRRGFGKAVALTILKLADKYPEILGASRDALRSIVASINREEEPRADLMAVIKDFCTSIDRFKPEDIQAAAKAATAYIEQEIDTTGNAKIDLALSQGDVAGLLKYMGTIDKSPRRLIQVVERLMNAAVQGNNNTARIALCQALRSYIIPSAANDNKINTTALALVLVYQDSFAELKTLAAEVSVESKITEIMGSNDVEGQNTIVTVLCSQLGKGGYARYYLGQVAGMTKNESVLSKALDGIAGVLGSGSTKARAEAASALYWVTSRCSWNPELQSKGANLAFSSLGTESDAVVQAGLVDTVDSIARYGRNDNLTVEGLAVLGKFAADGSKSKEARAKAMEGLVTGTLNTPLLFANSKMLGFLTSVLKQGDTKTQLTVLDMFATIFPHLKMAQHNEAMLTLIGERLENEDINVAAAAASVFGRIATAGNVEPRHLMAPSAGITFVIRAKDGTEIAVPEGMRTKLLELVPGLFTALKKQDTAANAAEALGTIYTLLKDDKKLSSEQKEMIGGIIGTLTATLGKVQTILMNKYRALGN
ncbi:MAG: hypothetical protein PHS37_08810, partial [Candidatus Omnitrophica bacterium]|nr:hypothetical protein [Candidatus Omnitrophota bacterium]